MAVTEIKLLREADPAKIAKLTDGTIKYKNGKVWEISYETGITLTWRGKNHKPEGVEMAPPSIVVPRESYLYMGSAGTSLSSAVILNDGEVTLVNPGPYYEEGKHLITGEVISEGGGYSVFRIPESKADAYLLAAKKLAGENLPWRK